jgi:Ca-activated chloride channel family protein
VVTHKIEIEVSGPSTRKIRLSGEDNIPNRDFVLRWTLAEGGPRHILLTHKPDKSAPGWFCMMLRPDYPQPTRGPCEVTFVMDISGSMTGKPIDMCKSVVRQALQNLRPDDTFNIVWFSGHNGQVFEAHRSADVDAVEEALRHLDGFKAGGGTNMKEGIQRAMQVRDTVGREQLFAFLTDGYVAEAPAIIEFVRKHGEQAQFMVFGVGSSVNRELIDGVAAAGNGKAVYCIPRDTTANEEAVRAFVQFLGQGGVRDASLDWGELPVSDVVPAKLPLLQAGQVVSVAGRFAGPAKGTLRYLGEAETILPVTFPELEEKHGPLRPLWASWRLGSLQAELPTESAARDTAIADLARFGIEERLATAWTAFVAIDRALTARGGNLKTVVQPVELPEDVDRKGVGR